MLDSSVINYNFVQCRAQVDVAIYLNITRMCQSTDQRTGTLKHEQAHHHYFRYAYSTLAAGQTVPLIKSETRSTVQQHHHSTSTTHELIHAGLSLLATATTTRLA